MQRLDASKLKFTEKFCDFCGDSKSQPVYTVPFLGCDFSFVRCLACGLVYQNPMLSKESRNLIYETLDYWAHGESDSPNVPMLNYYAYLKEDEERKRTCEIRLKKIGSYLSEGSTVLDLGCSDGLFVDTLNRNGFKAMGIDISSSMVAYGRDKYGADLVQADFESDWPSDEFFDAVTCYAALSNFTSASRVFEQISQNLKPGGHFFFNFGDCDRLISRMLGGRLYLYRPTAALIYSRNTLLNYCGKFGLKIRYIENDVQIVPLARLVGFLRIPGLAKMIKTLGLEKTSLKLTLLTGYTACAVLEN